MDILKKIFVAFLMLGLFVPMSFAENDTVGGSTDVDISVDANFDMIESIEFDEEMVKSNRAICNFLPTIEKQLVEFDKLLAESELKFGELEEVSTQEELEKFKFEREIFVQKRDLIQRKYSQLKKVCDSVSDGDSEEPVAVEVADDIKEQDSGRFQDGTFCEGLVDLKNELKLIDNKVKELKEGNVSSEEIQKYVDERRIVLNKLRNLELECRGQSNLINQDENISKEIFCDGLDKINVEIRELDNKIGSLKESGNLSEEEIEKYIEQREDMFDKLQDLKEKCQERREDKVDEYKNKREDIYNNFKQAKENYVEQRKELIEKRKNNELDFDEVKEFMLKGINSQIEKVSVYREKLNDSDFSRKDLVEGYLNVVEEKLNSYVLEVEDAETKEELLELGKEIKKGFEREANLFGYFNALVMTDNYDKIIDKIELVLDKVKSKYGSESFVSINRIEDKLSVVKLKIEQLDSSVESYDADNLESSLKDFKVRNQEIRQDLKDVYAELGDLKKEIVKSVEKDFEDGEKDE